MVTELAKYTISATPELVPRENISSLPVRLVTELAKCNPGTSSQGEYQFVTSTFGNRTKYIISATPELVARENISSLPVRLVTEWAKYTVSATPELVPRENISSLPVRLVTEWAKYTISATPELVPRENISSLPVRLVTEWAKYTISATPELVPRENISSLPVRLVTEWAKYTISATPELVAENMKTITVNNYYNN